MIVKARIGRSAEQAQEVEFLVDTGAFHTVLPPELMRELGSEAPISSWATVADNRHVEVESEPHTLALRAARAVSSVVEMAVPMPLLGVSALEALGFKVDPLERRLEADAAIWSGGTLR